MKLSLTKQIMIGAILGIALGVGLRLAGVESPASQNILYVSDIFKDIFINLLKMILIPLVFTSITVGIANLQAHAQMDRVWKWTIAYFLTSTSLAILLGLGVVNVFKPGRGMEITMYKEAMDSFSTQSLNTGEFLRTFLPGLFQNPFAAMAQGQILPTIIFGFILGIALVRLGPRAKLFNDLLNQFFEIIMLVVSWVMRFAPLGIMALLVRLTATQDPALLNSLAKFIMVVLGATLFHGLVVLPALLYAVTRFSPVKFFSATAEALITAFSTSSSSATVPVTLNCVEKNLKVDKGIAGFVVPLGATVNMDGTAIYEAVAALFIANLTGVELNLVQQAIVFITAMLASIGAPGIPSAGLVTMIMVLQSVGLPAEAIAILLPIDRFLDAFRTAVNVEGDCIGSLIVQHLTRKPSRSS